MSAVLPPQILLLAWPGMTISMVIIAVFVRYAFPYGWSWPESLLFAAMLSATDPVAVVAVLHEVCYITHYAWRPADPVRVD